MIRFAKGRRSGMGIESHRTLGNLLLRREDSQDRGGAKGHRRCRTALDTTPRLKYIIYKVRLTL